MPSASEPPLEFGVQPLDHLITQHQLTNKELVDASSEQLSFKMIQKGRRGRKLSRNVQFKILRAINAATEKDYQLKDLFNY